MDLKDADMVWIMKCSLVGASIEKFKEEACQRILDLDAMAVWSSLGYDNLFLAAGLSLACPIDPDFVDHRFLNFLK